MNEQQRLYLVQARSDWRVFKLLEDQPVCHRLHYLQMCAEKLGKAFAWRNQGAARLGHAAFVSFVRALADNRKVKDALGYSSRAAFREWINYVLDLAYELERLAPALAQNGPNPEYPWPRESPQHTPIEHDFRAWRNYRTRNGNDLRRMLELVLDNFETWF